MAATSRVGFFEPVRMWLVTDPGVSETLMLETALALDKAYGSAIGIWFRDKRREPNVALGTRLRDSLQDARFLPGSRELAETFAVASAHEPTLDFGPSALARSAPAHSLAEADAAVSRAADALMLSPIFKTKFANAAAGPELILRTREKFPSLYLYALGGITGANAASCVAAGANGVAVQGAIWTARSPLKAASDIVDALLG